jgi:FkbH-like protein
VFEVFLDQPRSRHLSTPVDVQAELAETNSSISMASGLVWGEHCTECAWPACYSSCSLYTPRQDLLCRRFEDGIIPVSVDMDVGDAGRGMRMGFRQWGKLEAHDQVRLSSVGNLSRVTRADEMVRGALRFNAIPFAMRRRAGHVWERLREYVRPLSDAPRPDDVFLLEAINEGKEPVPFTLTILDDGVSHRFFQHGFVLTPGYTRLLVPTSRIAVHVDLSQPVFVRIEPTVVLAGNSFVFTRVDFVRLRKPLPPRGGDSLAASAAPKVKCVIWDLDNTVWRGTLVEDGPDALQVRPEVVEIIQSLDARGILQSVASKNDAGEAQTMLERFGLAELMLYPQISWEPKSQAIGAVAQALDIGVDSVMFIDDQGFERAEVQAAHPCVRVVHAEDLVGLLDRTELEVPITVESRRRRTMYREESQRREVLAQAPSDFDAFLRSCQIELRLTPVSRANQERVYELAQRTNQLNYSGERLERNDITALIESAGPLTGVVMSASDRFGDYGIIGFVTINRASFTITNFFMSCRVQRKKLENAFFAKLLAAGCGPDVDELHIRHRATARNHPAVEVLQALGAEPAVWAAEGVDQTDEVLYTMRCSNRPAGADIVTVHDEVLGSWRQDTDR